MVSKKVRITHTRNTDTRLQSLQDWYASIRPSYDSLTKIVCGTIEGLLSRHHIDHLSVTRRAKTMDSVLEKTQRKDYDDPKKDIHDFAGIRVVTYIESDVDKTVDLIRRTFNVHKDKSLDKTTELGIDRMGYRSVHLVCDLGDNRESLPEYAPYKAMLFEVQVRTVLQHAWAEIEHDRNYKFAGTLPGPIQRRLYLAAGTLELVDHEFDSLAKAIDAHARMVSAETKKGNLEIPVDTTSITQFLKNKLADVPWLQGMTLWDPNGMVELKRFGIKTLADLDALITPDLIDAITRTTKHLTNFGLLRRAMMYADVDRYFSNVWRRTSGLMMPSTYECLLTKYSATKLNSVLKKHGVEVRREDNT